MTMLGRHGIATRALDNIFRPQRVVIVGASPEVGTARNSIVRVLLQTGYPGTIYLVSPRHKEIEGLTCYQNLTQLPEKPDLALIITPNTRWSFPRGSRKWRAATRSPRRCAARRIDTVSPC